MTASPAIALVERMIAGWEGHNAEAIAACFAEDAVWINVSYPPITSRAAIAGAARDFLGMATEVRFVVRHLGEIAPGIVVSERNDIFTLNDGRVIDIPIMGVFEITDGLIAEWRDYFDPAAMPG